MALELLWPMWVSAAQAGLLDGLTGANIHEQDSASVEGVRWLLSGPHSRLAQACCSLPAFCLLRDEAQSSNFTQSNECVGSSDALLCSPNVQMLYLATAVNTDLNKQFVACPNAQAPHALPSMPIQPTELRVSHSASRARNASTWPAQGPRPPKPGWPTLLQGQAAQPHGTHVPSGRPARGLRAPSHLASCCHC